MSAFADCEGTLASLELPVEVKCKGKRRIAKWEKVEKTLTELREGLVGQSCELRFDQVFSIEKEEAYFPLIANVLRTAPEDSLKDISVFSNDGSRLGAFSNRVTYEKQGRYNYTHYYFQFKDDDGELESSGNRMLIDIQSGKPLFLVKWDDLKERLAISTASVESGSLKQ